VKVALTERFQKDVRGLDPEQRSAAFEAILGLPRALGEPHLHAGLGLRKLHASGIWEVRVGLGLRAVFTFAENTATLVAIGTHDQVRRFLRSI
jgi:mRNA-degrading endonuclease RelE of RelBE toxin-antitoxin system